MRYLTAGESHGPRLTAIIEGVPAGLPLTADYINAELKRRQGGYGRGARCYEAHSNPLQASDERGH